jgi:hypothetical protein
MKPNLAENLRVTPTSLSAVLHDRCLKSSRPIALSARHGIARKLGNSMSSDRTL